MRLRNVSSFRVTQLHPARIFLVTLTVVTAAATCAQTTPSLTGLWKQDNDRCKPKRNGYVTLRIEDRSSALTVETSILRKSSSPQHAVQKYTTNGQASISTAADGDAFYTSVVRKDSSLVFSIEEHEDGRILLSKETWSLTEGGATLQRVRERSNNDHQTLFYRRIPITSSADKSEGVKAR